MSDTTWAITAGASLEFDLAKWKIAVNSLWQRPSLAPLLPLIYPSPFTLFPPSLSSILTPSFSPSVHFPCFFHVLGTPVFLHRMPRLQRRLPSRRLDLNIDDDKCPNLSRAISISRAEGEGVGWASDVCVNITYHCVPFICGVYHLHDVPCFVREQHGIQKNTAENFFPIAFADRIRPDLAIGSRTQRQTRKQV